jgi:hypothetical protein
VRCKGQDVLGEVILSLGKDLHQSGKNQQPWGAMKLYSKRRFVDRDSWSTAHASPWRSKRQAITTDLCGRQAADWDVAVGSGIADFRASEYYSAKN